MIGMLIFPRYYLVNKSLDNSTLEHKRLQFDPNDSTNMTDYKIYVKNKIFGSIKDSLLNLLILLTTSNNPDGILN